jgi:hypothetical protein
MIFLLALMFGALAPVSGYSMPSVSDAVSAVSDVAPSVDCWGEWSPWSPCNAPCGDGMQMRTYGWLRWPVNGGDSCPHENGHTETTPCNNGCAVNCYGQWSPWSPCNMPCGDGTQMRTYGWITMPLFGGASCPYQHLETQTQPCNNGCAVDCIGVWVGDMGMGNDGWSLCSSPCGHGTQHRAYGWVTPPLFGGTSCPHPVGYTETKPCNNEGAPGCDVTLTDVARAAFDAQVTTFMAALELNPFVDIAACGPNSNPECFDECNTIREYTFLMFKAAHACGIGNPTNPDNLEPPSGPSRCRMNCAFTSLRFTESCAPFVAAVNMGGIPLMAQIASSTTLLGVHAVRAMTMMLQGDCWINSQQLQNIVTDSPNSCLDDLLRGKRMSCALAVDAPAPALGMRPLPFRSLHAYLLDCQSNVTADH